VQRAFFLASVSLVLAVQTGTAAAATAFVGPAPSSKFAGNDAVQYVADAGETNHVTIDQGADFDEVEIRDTGATITPGAGCVSIAANAVRCSDPDRLIEAALGDGDDFLTVRVADWSVLRGEEGGDRIDAGDGSYEQTEYIFGGPGNDVLRGRRGMDVLNGGSGADLMSGGTSCDAELAGICFIHIDTITYAGRVNRVRADADIEAADDGESGEGDTIIADVERIIGGRGNDVLGGITTNDRFLIDPGGLVGMGLEGRAGNDVLRGTRARDSISGGLGDDTIQGARGDDELSGGRGNDRLVGERGKDRLGAGKGADRLVARDHRRDRVNGGPGRDEARVDAGLDRVISIAEFF
jgi:Ca2+-binding RTX toxin-like protein